MSKKFVYLFTEGGGDMKELLGGKGANLAEMTNLGMPVPQGFTITTEACIQYYEDGESIGVEVKNQIFEYVAKMEEICGKKFGDEKDPLLVSAPHSPDRRQRRYPAGRRRSGRRRLRSGNSNNIASIV